MKIIQRDLAQCHSCDQFVKTEDTCCPFCGGALKRPRLASPLLKASAGVVAAAAIYGMTAMMGCAYGAPPPSPDSGNQEVNNPADSGTQD